MLPSRACPLCVPELEAAVRRNEESSEIVVKAVDLAAVLEDLVVEPTLGIAYMAVSLFAVERSPAFDARHVARPEHVSEASVSVRTSLSLVGSAAA
jgi:hypothetical protein